MEQSVEIMKGIQKGLLIWYPFQEEKDVLYFGKENDVIAEMLQENSLKVTFANREQVYDKSWRERYNKRFTYIIAIETLEKCEEPRQFLYNLQEILEENGHMLLGMNNRFGIRYFCGDRDPYTERNFDGVENYRRAYSTKEDFFCGRCYSDVEIKRILKDAGWQYYRFFSVLSDLKNPNFIFAEDYLPNEDLANRVFPTYHFPDTVFLEEETLYESLIENGLFHKMANAFLIECSFSGSYSTVSHITSSMERGKEKALLTIIDRSGIVKKKAIYKEGQQHLEKLVEHGLDLQRHGISVVDMKMENGACVMPYYKSEVGQIYLKRLLKTDKKKFLETLDHFRDLILQSSEIVKMDEGDGEGALLRKGYYDMVPLNSFYENGTFVFYDQEFCREYFPANAIITRMITTFYAGNNELQKIISAEELFDRYGLTKKLDYWIKLEREFLAELRREKVLRNYHSSCRCNYELIHSNRQRLNYSVDEYQRRFVDIFHNLSTRKLIIFGSGKFAKKFIELYSKEYAVYAIVDNKEEAWGQEINGIVIQPPAILNKLQNGEYKVLICIKNYLSVMKQLDTMGITEYSIFDSGKDYPRMKRSTTIKNDEKNNEIKSKKYHVGYIAGVFDLFHVGHLNLLRRAKEQCNYLIVGVVTDEGVRKYKGTEPFVSFDERIELVRACQYVDEAVEIPLNYGGTRDAYRLYHFDCQFSGSDYIDNPDWLSDKEFLEKHGAEMVFFPYTQSTSSTKLKAIIEKKLI